MTRHLGKQVCNNRKRFAGIRSSTILIIFTFLVLLVPSVMLAQAAPYPRPIYPPTNATGINITSIDFRWEPFYVGVEEYTLELSQNGDMSNPIIQATASGDANAYKFTGTLEYKTTYYWRVKVSKPIGPESPVSIFTTKAAAASSNNVTAPPKDSSKKSFPGSLIVEIEKLGWPLVGGIAGIIVIIIIALLLMVKPKAPPGQGQWRGAQQSPRTPQPPICPICGTPNTTERRFCNNCGANLMSNKSPHQAWSPPPPQQGIVCPTCGFPNNPPGQKFCGNCGTPIFIGGQQPPRGAPQVNVCPSCGTSNPPGQKFCNRCGTGLAGGAQQQTYQVYQTFSCPICGTPINKGINPCPNCRTWLDWGAY